MLIQLKYFVADYKRICGRKKSRLLLTWLNRNAVGVFTYRLERGLYLLFGKYYFIIRILFLPFFLLMYAYSNLDIHYKADIGPGLKVLHPAIGLVISGESILGKNLTVTGGNVIGSRGGAGKHHIVIGDNCTMGANSCIIGPLILGNNVNIGAGAVVVKDAQDNAVLVGVPAKNVKINLPIH